MRVSGYGQSMAAEALALSWASTWLKTREGARRNSFDDAPPPVRSRHP
jgi:hypothetical protein